LLSEEFDPRTRRLLGNLPQALSHIARVNFALKLKRQSRRSNARKARFDNVQEVTAR
jgi:GH15 family glucan-1,4-alpha-glucosidase